MEINLEEVELLEEGAEVEPEVRTEGFAIPSDDEELEELNEEE